MNKGDSFYYELSDFYWLYSSKKNYKEESQFLLSLIKKHNKNAIKILDIGCGEGDHLSHFQNKFKCFGIDKSKFQINKAKEKYKKISFRTKDIINEDITGKYDVITILWNTLLYISPIENLKKVFEKLKSNLKKGGILIFDFRSFQKHIDKGEFTERVKVQIEKGYYRMDLFRKNTINKKRKIMTEETISRIYKNDKLVKKLKHAPVELNILHLKPIKRILKEIGYDIEEILDAKSLYKNKIIRQTQKTMSYLICAKLSTKN